MHTQVVECTIDASGSHSYLHATRDVQVFFPNGLCCEQNSFTEDNKVHIYIRADDTIDIIIILSYCMYV